jgi:hypothetical protein
MAMDGTGNQLLAGAALALDQDSYITVCHHADHFINLLHLLRPADDAAGVRLSRRSRGTGIATSAAAARARKAWCARLTTSSKSNGLMIYS